jgi:hypothetical protein
MFRFYEQSAASFYKLGVNGLFPSTIPSGSLYSSDYRLSEFYSLDFGLDAKIIINDHFRFDFGYHRYDMEGLDRTPSTAYPQANVFTAGFSILW